MVETNDRDDIGAAFDRARVTDLAIPNGFGRHDNDGMFSFYVASPAGFAVEVGHGARTIGEDWDDSRHHRVSAWGPPAAAPAANRRTTAVKLANIAPEPPSSSGARSPTSPSCPAAGSAPSS